MQQRQVRAELLPYGSEHRGHVPQVRATVPALLHRRGRSLRRLVVVLCAGFLVGPDAVDQAEPRDRRLHPDGPKPQIQMILDRGEQRREIRARGVPVRQGARPGGPAEQLVDRLPGHLAQDVPQRDIDGGDRGHRDRPPAPVRAPVEVLPGVLDGIRVAADQQRRDVLFEVGHDRQLTTVQRGVPETGDAVGRGDPQGDEVPSGAGHEDIDPLDRAHSAPQYQPRNDHVRIYSRGPSRGEAWPLVGLGT